MGMHRAHWGWAILLMSLAAGCDRGKPSADKPAGASPSVSLSASASAVSSSPAQAPPASASAPSPEGYVSAHVMRVVIGESGSAVLLQSDADGRVLPIFVGGTEALSIGLRSEAKRYPRPLTHDLLDSVVHQLGGVLVKVHVDSLSSNIFIGRVYVRQGDRLFDVDARPSDALALALGNRVPIFVARKVLDAAALRPEDLTLDEEEMPNPRTGRPDEPTQL